MFRITRARGSEPAFGTYMYVAKNKTRQPFKLWGNYYQILRAHYSDKNEGRNEIEYICQWHDCSPGNVDYYRYIIINQIVQWHVCISIYVVSCTMRICSIIRIIVRTIHFMYRYSWNVHEYTRTRDLQRWKQNHDVWIRPWFLGRKYLDAMSRPSSRSPENRIYTNTGVRIAHRHPN